MAHGPLQMLGSLQYPHGTPLAIRRRDLGRQMRDVPAMDVRAAQKPLNDQYMAPQRVGPGRAMSWVT